MEILDNQYALLVMAVLVALVILAVAGAVYTLLLRRDPVQRRLGRLSGEDFAGRGPGAGARDQMQQVFTRLINRVADIAKPRQSWQLSKLQQQLQHAGYRGPMAANVMITVKVALALLLPLALFFSPFLANVKPGTLPIVLGVGALAGFVLPNYYLRGKVSARQQRVSRELPDVLDLLAISVEAGLGLDAAINRVSKEMQVSSPTLGAELKFTALELRAGIPRPMALKNLGNRCGVEELTSLVSMLNQADRFGVSVGRSLRVHSDTVRTKRRQRMEELAAKIPLKLLFPVLFLIFPSIMAVMAGPAILRVMDSFAKP